MLLLYLKIYLLKNDMLKRKEGKFSPALTVTAFVGCEESGNGGSSLPLCLWDEQWTMTWIEV